MKCLIARVEADEEWVNTPDLFVLPLSDTNLKALEDNIRAVELGRRDFDMICINCAFYSGILTRDETLSEMLDNNADEKVMVVDVDFFLDPDALHCHQVQIWASGGLTFLSGDDYANYCTPEIDWTWLSERVITLKGEPKCLS